MRLIFLILCSILAGTASAASKKASGPQLDKADIRRSAEREGALKEARASWRLETESLRKSERTEIQSIYKDRKRSDAEKLATAEQISKKYSQNRWELRRRMNADFRLRLLNSTQEK